MTFVGKDRVDAKRRALNHWYRHHRPLGMTLRQFLTDCRMGPDERTIVYLRRW